MSRHMTHFLFFYLFIYFFFIFFLSFWDKVVKQGLPRLVPYAVPQPKGVMIFFGNLTVLFPRRWRGAWSSLHIAAPHAKGKARTGQQKRILYTLFTVLPLQDIRLPCHTSGTGQWQQTPSQILTHQNFKLH